MNRIGLLLVVLIFGISQSLSAQKRIMVQAIDVIEGKKKFSLFQKNSGSGEALRVVPPYCINFFANNKKFTVIDRQNLTLINAEKELQKSEEFIDGYIVDQGKSEGADYVLKGLYLENEKNLNLKIYDVATGAVLCGRDETLETNIFGIKNFESRIHNMLHDMLYDCFDIKYSVVRTIEVKKDEAKTILVAIGKKHRAKIEDRLEIYTLVTEDIDGEQVQRKVLLGEGELIEIQDENFSVLKVKRGNKEILKSLTENKKLFCLVKNIFD